MAKVKFSEPVNGVRRETSERVELDAGRAYDLLNKTPPRRGVVGLSVQDPDGPGAITVIVDPDSVKIADEK